MLHKLEPWFDNNKLNLNSSKTLLVERSTIKTLAEMSLPTVPLYLLPKRCANKTAL